VKKNAAAVEAREESKEEGRSSPDSAEGFMSDEVDEKRSYTP